MVNLIVKVVNIGTLVLLKRNADYEYTVIYMLICMLFLHLIDYHVLT